MPFPLTALLLAAATGLAFAQAPQSDDQKRLAELERKIAILSQELEGQKSGGIIPEAAEGKHGFAPAASKVYGIKSGLSIGGYGEMLYENFASRLENGSYSPKSNSVNFYRQILYVGYKFSDRIVLNTEVEFEHAYVSGAPVVTKNKDGAVTDVKAARPGAVEVEFAYLDFLLMPAVNVRAGMMLVPMGFINEMHEPPTFLGAARPLVERDLIPTTWRENGVGVHGELGKGLAYRLYLMAGLDGSKFTKGGIKDGRQHGAKSVAESLALTGRLDWTPLPGTTLGFSFFNGNSQQGDNLPELQTRLLDLHGELRWQGWQARALMVRTTVDGAGLPATGSLREVGTTQKGGYVEVGYDVLSGGGSRQALIPFLRQERVERQAEVHPGVLKDPALSERILTAGIVYKPIPQVALKADFNRIRNDARTGRNQVSLALGYYF